MFNLSCLFILLSTISMLTLSHCPESVSVIPYSRVLHRVLQRIGEDFLLIQTNNFVKFRKCLNINPRKVTAYTTLEYLRSATALPAYTTLEYLRNTTALIPTLISLRSLYLNCACYYNSGIVTMFL